MMIKKYISFLSFQVLDDALWRVIFNIWEVTIRKRKTFIVYYL